MRTAGSVAPTPFSVRIDSNERLADVPVNRAGRNREIVTHRTHRDLVDRFCDAMGLFDKPRAAGARRRIRGTPSAAPAAPTSAPAPPVPPAAAPGGSRSFLNDWLAAREAKNAGRSTTGGDTGPAPSSSD